MGDLNKVNLLDFPNALRLWELWYQQKFFNGKLTFKVGQLSIDRDFIVPEYYNSLGSLTLINQTFFYPTIAFNLYDIPGCRPVITACPRRQMPRRALSCAGIRFPRFTPSGNLRWRSGSDRFRHALQS